jgi:ariadne-1
MKDEKPAKKAYEVDYRALSAQTIREEQASQVNEIATLFGLSSEQCAILLRHFKWQRERLIERYMDNPDTVLEAAGLGTDSSKPPKLEKIRDFMCEICCDDSGGLDTYAMKCDHRYCVNCFRQYLESKIKDEGEAARIQCPSEGCSRIVDSKSIKLLVPPDIYAR